MDVPVACSLTADDAATRMAEWRTFLHGSVVSSARDADGLDLRLVHSDDVLLAAADLAAREQACCPFFSMTIRIDAGGRTLTLGAPPDAAGVLDGFMGLLADDGA
jgi:MerR family transcriptional regulator, copper efflux regulator